MVRPRWMKKIGNSVYRGDLVSPAGRRNAWMDSLFVDHAVLRLVWTNFAAVVPGALYRSNHPTPGRLARFVRRHGIRTLINLRGPTRSGSYALSTEAAGRLGLDIFDLALESRGAPHRDRILKLAEIYRGMRRPALVHCKSGADRAGLAAALFILIEGGSTAQARRQLSLRFGHIRQSKTGILDAFLDTWAAEGEGKRPFLAWVASDYDENRLRESFKSAAFARFVNDKLLARE